MNQFKTMDQEELQVVNGGNPAIIPIIIKVAEVVGTIGAIGAGVDAAGEAGKAFMDGFKESFN